MRRHRRAGEKLRTDYAGATLALADGSRAQVFVVTMGASSCTLACATADQSMCSWLGVMARALSVQLRDQQSSNADPWALRACLRKGAPARH